ncbi:adenosine 3'-phospho 5'-phosphosulfate transporter 2 [Neocloeon triangulifer]|uniref:adenosine 3'-phospho 5'-phosphosulfate transporter 2 n=1 Tax=Neocloeon triangulifer TaxID=2078957 RepID=UPI00286F6F4A|nr:adenosine 3'-phospho 5'-phosphosulfate transporter 2 [Neocloeon triangulifer]
MSATQILIGDEDQKSIRKKDHDNETKIVCFNISHFSQQVQFLLCSVAVFAFYLLYGYMQELLFTLEGFKSMGWQLTLVQFGYYTIFGVIETRIKDDTIRRIPFKTYCVLALLTLGTMGFSNSSLGYLNYPTQVIFKCCKLIPVMIGSVLLQSKRYGFLDVSAVICMCVGLVLFTLADTEVSPNFNVIGVVMISCALLCDAIIGNLQEKSMKSHKASNTEVVLYSYGIGFVYLFLILLTTGNLFRGFAFFSEHPVETYGYALIFSLTGYLGIQVVLTLVRTCGALAAATVTTARKAVTIALSFLAFTKPFTMQYFWAGSIVVLGIYLNVFSKKHKDFGPKDLVVIINKLKSNVVKPKRKIIASV